MKELSMNILDIAENSLRAGADFTQISLIENDQTLTMTVTDNGCGMSEQTVQAVTDPFFTTRTTRKVGLGIPLLKLAAEQTGGYVEILSGRANNSNGNHGTKVSALFYKKHIDYTPLGNIISTLITLIQGHPDVDFLFIHIKPGGKVQLDTRELREVLGNISLDNYEILKLIRENLEEQYNSI